MEMITLRPYKLSDVEDFMEWACDPAVLGFSRLHHWVNPDSTRDQIQSYFIQQVFHHPWYRAICLNGHTIGFISIEPAGGGGGGSAGSVHKGRASLAYAIGRSYWGRGIGTSALRMAVPAAFRDLPNLLRIEALVDPENKASYKLLEKVGFLKEGLLRKYLVINGVAYDFFLFSILYSDPLPSLIYK